MQEILYKVKVIRKYLPNEEIVFENLDNLFETANKLRIEECKKHYSKSILCL